MPIGHIAVNLHEMLGLGPEEYMRFFEQAVLVIVMVLLALVGMIIAYAHGRVDEWKSCESGGISHKTVSVITTETTQNGVDNPSLSVPCSASDVSDKYHELLFAVGRCFPGESRHDTALRYIRETERRGGETGSCMQNDRVSGPLVRFAMSMYTGEKCQGCGKTFDTVESLHDSVWWPWAEGRVGHKACYEKANEKVEAPK